MCGRGQASNLGAWELLLEKQILSVTSQPGLCASEQRKDLQCPILLWPGCVPGYTLLWSLSTWAGGYAHTLIVDKSA